MKTALVVIDLQKAWYNDTTKSSMDGACLAINMLKPLFRGKGLPVYYVQHENPSAGIISGTQGFEFLEAIAPVDGEPIFVKRYGNAFNKTSFHEALLSDGVDTIILTGFRAENCVLSTYRGALDLDLTPIILRGAIAGPIQAHNQFVEAISETISIGALKKMLALG